MDLSHDPNRKPELRQKESQGAGGDAPVLGNDLSQAPPAQAPVPSIEGFRGVPMDRARLAECVQAWSNRPVEAARELLLSAPEGRYELHHLIVNRWEWNKGEFGEVSPEDVVGAALRCAAALPPEISNATTIHHDLGTREREVILRNTWRREDPSAKAFTISIEDREGAGRAAFSIMAALGKHPGIAGAIESVAKDGEGRIKRLQLDEPAEIFGALGLEAGIPKEDLAELIHPDELKTFIEEQWIDQVNNKHLAGTGKFLFVDWDKTYRPEVGVYLQDDSVAWTEPDPGPDAIDVRFDHHLGGAQLTDQYGRTTSIDREDDVAALRYGLPYDQIQHFDEGFSIRIPDPGYFEGIPFTPGKNDPDCAAVSRDGRELRYMGEVLAVVEKPENMPLTFLRSRILMGKSDLELKGFSESNLQKSWPNAFHAPSIYESAQILISMGYQIGPYPLSAGQDRLVVDSRMTVCTARLRTEGLIDVELDGTPREPIKVMDSGWAPLMGCHPDGATAILVALRLAQEGLADPPSIITEQVPSGGSLSYVSLRGRIGAHGHTECAFRVDEAGQTPFETYGLFPDDRDQEDGGLRNAVLSFLETINPEMVGMNELLARTVDDFGEIMGENMFLSDVVSPRVMGEWDSRTTRFSEIALELRGDKA